MTSRANKSRLRTGLAFWISPTICAGRYGTPAATLCTTETPAPGQRDPNLSFSVANLADSSIGGDQTTDRTSWKHSMARKPPSEPPPEKEWTPESIRGALRKVRRRLTDVEAFDPQKVTRQFDPAVTSLEISIGEMLADVFGANGRSYRSYQPAATLDMAGLNMNGTPLHEVIDGLMRGKEQSITLLNGAIRFFEEKMQDDFPGEPFDQAALSGSTVIASTASGNPSDTLGVRAHGAAGTIRVSIQNDTPTGGVIIEPPFEVLMRRVALLETSLSELRRELNAPTSVGIGHNRGPEFNLASDEELDDIDELIALLKEQGPNPPTDRKNLVERSQRATLIAEKINAGLFAIGDELAKGAAREAGKEMLIPLWTAVSHWIASVGHGLLTWLGNW
jgi:hypothetical protein